MSKKKILVAFILLIIFPVKVYAAEVNLNEIYANPPDETNEFIELYNTTSSDILISGWKIADKVKSYTLPENSTISANGFFVLKKSTTGLELNNSDEEITLKKSSDESVDSFSYSDTVQGKSWSRVSNGTGSFVNNVEITEGATNASAPTSAPTNAPTSTSAPTPTKTPTPEPTLTPTKSPTVAPTKLISPTNIPKVTPSPTIDPNSDLKIENSNDNKVFGDSSDSPTPAEGEVLGTSTSQAPLLFIALGLIFLIVCGILVYLQFGDRILLRLRKKSE